MPFSHDIAGGNGNLVVTSVQSPNFVHGVSGWKIAKDGSAEFQDVIIPAGSGGTVVTFSATEPEDPNDGDVWYNTANGLAASVYGPGGWTPYYIGAGAIGDQVITAQQIADVTITAAQIADVSVTVNKFQSQDHYLY